jgi:hypothetical protein
MPERRRLTQIHLPVNIPLCISCDQLEKVDQIEWFGNVIIAAALHDQCALALMANPVTAMMGILWVCASAFNKRVASMPVMSGN